MAKSERMLQNSYTGPIRPLVSIIGKTEDPIGQLFCVWSGTRYPDIMSPKIVQSLYDNKDRYGYDLLVDYETIPLSVEERKTAETICNWYPEYAGENKRSAFNVILSIARKVIESNVPAGESVHFNIQIDDANVAWREQLVRGRISQQFWTMSTRIMDMTTMDVNMNDSVRLIGGDKAVAKYEECVDFIRDTYKFLVEECGVPMEDIRLQPQGHTHRVYWMVPLRTLITILNKRCDWIAQASLWTPIVSGAVQELRRLGLYDIVSPFIGKPMVKVDYNIDLDMYGVYEYIMNADNEDRYSGRDKIPCDPLWLAYKHVCMPEHTDIEFYDYLKSLYIQLWQDDYLRVLGWDRNDPEKIGKYDRPYSWFESQGRVKELGYLKRSLSSDETCN